MHSLKLRFYFLLWGVGLSFLEGIAQGKTTVPIELTLIWEGRELQEPNLDILAQFRDEEPDIPIIQLVSPTYFLHQENRSDQAKQIQAVIRDHDEVGLYVSAQRPALLAARVIPRSQPSFWSYSSEGNTCGDDCGIDIPPTLFPREDILKIFAMADGLLRKAGYSRLRTYAVRGGMDVPLMKEMARTFGYRFDQTAIDPTLFQLRFAQYPIGRWISASNGSPNGTMPILVGRSRSQDRQQDFKFQGGMIDLQDPSTISQRFVSFLESRKASDTSGFQVSLSQESAYIGVAKLRSILAQLRNLAKDREFELEFRTRSGEKNGRPIEAGQRISGNP